MRLDGFYPSRVVGDGIDRMVCPKIDGDIRPKKSSIRDGNVGPKKTSMIAVPNLKKVINDNANIKNDN